MRDIFVFGDSMAYGQWDEQGGWAQRLRSSYDQSYVASRAERTYIYNLGIPGETTEDVLKRFKGEMEPRFVRQNDSIVLFALGMNDSHMVHKTQRWKFKPEQFEANLVELVSQCRPFTDKIGFIGLNPVDEAKVTPLPWNPEKSYQNGRVKEFNDIIEKLTQREKLFFVDVWSAFAQQDHKQLLSDGLHPNASGHRKIAEKVNAFLMMDEGKRTASL